MKNTRENLLYAVMDRSESRWRLRVPLATVSFLLLFSCACAGSGYRDVRSISSMHQLPTRFEHRDHHESATESLLHEMRQFLTQGDVSDEEAIKGLAHVVFARLRCNPSRDCSMYELHQAVDSFLSKFTIKNETLLFEERNFNFFCHSLLLSALHHCCEHTSSDLHISSSKELIERVVERYDRRSALSSSLSSSSSSFQHYSSSSISSSLLPRLEIEAYANRFLCIRMGDVTRWGRPPFLPWTLTSTVIVKYIMYGYNIIPDSAACPIEILHELYDTVANNSKHVTMEGLNKLFTGDSLDFALAPDHPPHSNPVRAQDLRRWISSTNLRPSTSGNNQNNDTLAVEAKSEHEHGDNHNDGSAAESEFEHGSNNHGNHGSSPSSHHNSWWWWWHRQPTREDNPMLHTKADFDGVGNIQPPKRDFCQTMTVGDLYAMYNLHNTSRVDLQLFVDLCPILLHQVLAPPCRHPPTPVVTTLDTPSDVNAYLCGTLAVLVISLCSLLGACFLRLSNGAIKSYLMATMLSLAVGCLVADAALHLLPEILVKESEHEEDGVMFSDALGKMCALLGSVYAFFVLELVLSKYHKHSHNVELTCNHDDNVNNEIPLENTNQIVLRKIHNATRPGSGEQVPKALNNDVHATTSNASDKSTSSNKSTADCVFDVASVEKTRTDSCNVVTALERLDSTASNVTGVHSHNGGPELKGVQSLAWMIVIGDAIHNFADGLAIGAAFSLSFTKGLSTSITVLCHELPHELGDFAVLVSTGLSIQRAMVLNFVSSLTAFAGLYIGLSVGEQAEASEWIFSIGAGMFLYVALTDLVPECKEYFIRKPTKKMFLGENLGLLLGYGFMLLLAVFEHQLQISA